MPKPAGARVLDSTQGRGSLYLRPAHGHPANRVATCQHRADLLKPAFCNTTSETHFDPKRYHGRAVNRENTACSSSEWIARHAVAPRRYLVVRWNDPRGETSVARGTAKFAPSILRKLRESREVEGRLLSAAELARLLKTSKARVLAYEQGTSTPEPGRVVQMARIFAVPPRELYQASEGVPDQIRDLRCYAGLTAAELAAQVGVSRTTYRDVERLAILPARDDGTLPLKLSEALGLPLGMIHRALDNHPAAAERRIAIAEQLSELFQRADTPHQAAQVSPDEEPLLKIAELLHRPASVVCRLVNYDLTRYRELLRRRAVAQVNQAYAQTPRAAQKLTREIADLTKDIRVRPFAAAATQLRFLAEAMTSQQWRTLLSLMSPQPVLFSPDVFEDLHRHGVWNGLKARRYIVLESAPEGVTVGITQLAWDACLSQRRHYECLYPRIVVPRSIARPGRAADWLHGARRGVLPPVTVGTIDRLLPPGNIGKSAPPK
ncbi:helix-turn-helix domain-containing protein [Streptomyces sp. NPDC051064]|uniref:helix-turn-helix domain-containing protein n=1 Tax=Streptomyces sp. NPDC051064 TaxID=3365641 RepID=UPI003795503A